MKYYAITKGSYEDYHIITITTDKERAELIAKLHSTTQRYDGEARVEEYEDGEYSLLPLFKIEYEKETLYVETVNMHYAQTPYESGDYNIDGEDIELNKVYSFEYEGAPLLYFYVRARGEENAKKIAYDLIAEYKSKNFGLV